jgi:hypothetical protein
MMDAGSTVMSKAPLVAVEWSSPSLASQKAAPKPRVPIQNSAQRSRRVRSGCAGSPRTRASGSRMIDPMTRRPSESVDGGMSSTTTRVTR